MDLTFLLISVSILAGCHIILSVVAGYLAWYYRKQWKRLQASRSTDREDRTDAINSREPAQNALSPSSHGTSHEEDHNRRNRRREDSQESRILDLAAARTRHQNAPKAFGLGTFNHPRTPPKPPMPAKSPERSARTPRASLSLAAEIAKIGESSKNPQTTGNGKCRESIPLESGSWHVGSPVSNRPMWSEYWSQDVQGSKSQDGYI